MSLATKSPRSTSLMAFVCLALVVSFLFNPFQVAGASGGRLNLCHRASYRATVASSELEKYSSFAAQDADRLALLDFVNGFSLLPAPAASFPLSDALRLLPPRRLFFACLWFRPPPAL